MDVVDLQKAREVFISNGNVTEYLKVEYGRTENSAEIIEIAYDLQTGAYVEHALKNAHYVKQYCAELAKNLGEFVNPGDSVLDVGSGELTTLTFLSNEMSVPFETLHACDISFSRLHHGLKFFREHSAEGRVIDLKVHVSDMAELPFGDKSLDVVISSHALEPNRGREAILLAELFRVSKRFCILFEPSYELNSEAGRARMDQHGYIKDLELHANNLGAEVVQVGKIETAMNPLNPTACFVIRPPQTEVGVTAHQGYTVPGTSHPLEETGSFLQSSATGLVFPVLREIPILRKKNAILASDLFK